MKDEEIVKRIRMLEEEAKKKLTKEAWNRYVNLRIAHPDIAIESLLEVTKSKEIIDDEKYKQILIKINKRR